MGKTQSTNVIPFGVIIEKIEDGDGKNKKKLAHPISKKGKDNGFISIDKKIKKHLQRPLHSGAKPNIYSFASPTKPLKYTPTKQHAQTCTPSKKRLSKVASIEIKNPICKSLFNLFVEEGDKPQLIDLENDKNVANVKKINKIDRQLPPLATPVKEQKLYIPKHGLVGKMPESEKRRSQNAVMHGVSATEYHEAFFSHRHTKKKLPIKEKAICDWSHQKGFNLSMLLGKNREEIQNRENLIVNSSSENRGLFPRVERAIKKISKRNSLSVKYIADLYPHPTRKGYLDISRNQTVEITSFDKSRKPIATAKLEVNEEITLKDSHAYSLVGRVFQDTSKYLSPQSSSKLLKI